MSVTLYAVRFSKNYAPNQGAAYAVGEQAAFALDAAVRLVGQGWAEFSDVEDLNANLAAVQSATPVGLIGADVFIQPQADGSDPQVILRRRA